MSYPARYETKVAFAKSLRSATIHNVRSKLRATNKKLTDKDSVRGYIKVSMSVSIQDSDKKTSTIPVELDTEEFDLEDRRDIWFTLCKAFHQHHTPSSYKIKETKVAFTALMARVMDAVNKERDSRPEILIRKNLNNHFAKKTKERKQYEFNRAKEAFKDLLEEGFCDITEEDLLTIFREQRIEMVMDE